MAVLSIRNFDPELLKELKVIAAKKCKPLREYVMEALGESLALEKENNYAVGRSQ